MAESNARLVALQKHITNHIRKVEALQEQQRLLNKLMQNEVACLHECLNELQEELDLAPVEESVTVMGGQPKEKPPIPS